MTVPARRERPIFGDLMDWFESEFPALPIMRPFTGGAAGTRSRPSGFRSSLIF
jgi:hypothetical protein